VECEGVKFNEGAFVKEFFHPFPGCELALFMLFFDALGSASELGFLLHFTQFFNLLFHGHLSASEFQDIMGWISNYLPKGFLDYKNCDWGFILEIFLMIEDFDKFP
jgi:hypothetical protein